MGRNHIATASCRSGNTVGSAINVVQKFLYDIDHPLPGQPARSLKVQEGVRKERAFYDLFLEKL